MPNPHFHLTTGTFIGPAFYVDSEPIDLLQPSSDQIMTDSITIARRFNVLLSRLYAEQSFPGTERYIMLETCHLETCHD